MVHQYPDLAEKHLSSQDDDLELNDILLTNPHQGLSLEQVAERLQTYGKNELVEVRQNRFLKFLGYFVGPIAFLIQLACVISAIVKVSNYTTLFFTATHKRASFMHMSRTRGQCTIGSVK